MARNPVLIALLTYACIAAFGANAAPPSQDTSYDGLQRRESKAFEQVWVRKYFDVRSYTKIIFEPPHIEYRPVMKGAGADAAGSKVFPLDKRQKDSLYQIINTAFSGELAKSKFFKLTTEQGPDVLMVRGSLVDVVSFVPPSESGRNDLLSADIGEATLVLELYDSLSGAIVVRANEHVVAKHDAGAPPTTAAEAVQRTALAWATVLRERLDAAAGIPPNQ